MNVRTVVLVLAALAVGDAAAQVNALPPTRHILVYGDAQARAIPDRFKVALNFEAIDLAPDVARQRVEADVKEVLGRLKAANVPEGEIVATSLQIGPRHRYDQSKQDQVFIGTGVARSLTARFDKQSDLQAFLAGIKTSKELTISAVTTGLSDEQKLRAALRQKSIESSREKAEVIAKAYGARIAGVYSVSDVAPQFQYGIQEGGWPSMYEWRREDGFTGSLDRIEVSGTRLRRQASESMQTGYVAFDDKIYAVFLLAD
ncbi:MAG TPA: SIMPL domain-containing protein [Pseudoxanthomonas sp.]|nr:SIMPL domain-containing protein [Pseudoxanthomonas sp.]